jgi:MoxR-like ATPase
MKKNNLTERIETIANTYRTIDETTREMVVGNHHLIRAIFVTMISGGHLLIEGTPGTAKTTISKTIARLINYDFKRIQGAVDIQPADIIGVRVYDRNKSEFILQKGPIFADFLMVDEMNRLTPKTQSALLEAMSEGQVTIDGETHLLPTQFFVIATQNPHEVEGTFPLIEAQRDRFMFSAVLTHLDAENELEVIRREQAGGLDWRIYHDRIRPVIGPEEVAEMAATVRQIRIDESVMAYIRDLVTATRLHSDIRLGASSRASIAFVRGSRVLAALNGRDYVIPDDVRELAHPVFRHRLLLTREATITGLAVDAVIDEILDSVEVS